MKPQILDIGYVIKPESLLWALDIVTEEISIEELRANLDIPYLDQEGTDDWNLTPRMLLSQPEKELSHMQKVRNADLSFPIEIYNNKGTWIILDGVHRYTKAVMEGRTTISVRKVSEAMLQSFHKQHDTSI